MASVALPVLTKWPCSATCITAYDGFCERFTYTGIWPATAQCLLSSCGDKDRIAVQQSVGKYCDAVGFPDVWGPYMWAASDDDDEEEEEDATPSSTSAAPPSRSTAGRVSSSPSPSALLSSSILPSVQSTPTTFLISTTTPTQTSLPNDIDSSASSSSITSVLPSSTSSPEPQPSGGLSTAAKAGIAVAAAFVLLFIVLIFLWRWRQKRKEANFPEGPDHFSSGTPSPTEKAFDGDHMISYTIEGGTLKRQDKKPANLSIKVV